MNDKELLLCPFCGGTVRIVVVDDEGNAHGDEYENDPWSGLGYMLYHDITETGGEECPIAGHEGEGLMGTWIYDNREEAIEAWNRRCVPPAKTLGDAELVRSLEICTQGKCSAGCLYRSKVACRDVLIREIFDFINRQNTEIERLNHIRGELSREIDAHKLVTSYLERRDADFCGTPCKFVDECIVKAIHVFAEKLKTLGTWTFPEDVDDLVKEMTEAQHD